MNPAAVAWLIFVAGDIPPAAPKAAESEEIREDARMQVLGCNSLMGYCAIAVDDLAAYIRKHSETLNRLDKAEAEAKKLRELKGCAKLEVLPKPEIKPDGSRKRS